MSELSKYTAEEVKLRIKIEHRDEELNKLHGLSKHNIKAVSQKKEIYLDEAVKSLSNHFIKKTGKPRYDLSGKLFLLFDLFKQSIGNNDFKKAQNRIKQRRSSLSI